MRLLLARPVRRCCGHRSHPLTAGSVDRGRAAVVPTWQRTITGLHSKANTIAGAMTDNALAAPPTADPSRPGRISVKAGRRRTFAVISHPDAGKSTLTEALALHARAITEAGA